ncbi:acyl-CoA dehydrogenase family member 10 [Tripterygium wilfordii]|uniref:Acyl-CoA dehydrogenase family member 10 n=1 Tax=Tripterygium wilfordii TaxID=458696 RepID=A0A7J7E165_TRIWF|nr:probable acyl-CoA dehydrogenase IBR3 [Tripterygium wilfordii]KAF5752184.1 acyl-CoA dehydrogenase family member 10 [Tripterygium wilfordii]
MASRTSDLLTQVDPAYQLDLDALLRYASANVPGFPVSPSSFTLSQFGHGQSNPTYLMEVGTGGAVERYVLRKKPPGKLLESAHAVDREFQVLKALGDLTQVPVPKAYCLCNDPSVIGTAFYIMEFLNGRIFVDPSLPGVAPERRRAIYREMARALASLHSANVDAIGLGKYGRRDNYCRRQVERWAKQYIASTGEGKSDRNPKMLELVDWLRQNMPREDSSGTLGGLVHGDFRMDNLVFHPIEDRVIGVLDWELSTLGNQMCDVAYCCLPYILDISHGKKQIGQGFEFAGIPEGIPSQAEFLAEYCSAAGKVWPAAEWKFYVAFASFRGASIYAGVHSRWLMGNASGGERARYTGNIANGLIDSAWAFIGRKSVLPEHRPSEGIKTYNLKNSSEANKHESFLREGGTFVPSTRVAELRNRLIKFMEDNIYPMENDFSKLALSSSRWTIHPEEEKLKELAKKEGLWNLFIPIDSAARAKKLLFDGNNHGDESDLLLGAGLSNLEYGYLCEVMGRSLWAPQVFNCGAPDTGNMEVLLRYGNKDQLKEWLIPLLQGKIRSGFAMTEPQVASSDATNIECSITREGDSYIINGTKWWTSGAMDPRCKLLIVMGKTDFSAPKHKQQSMILVDMQTPGIHVKRALTVFGFDDAPHGHAEILFQNVRVPAKNILLGEGRGFEIAQGRLGPGRLHHCMRLIGVAERGMQLMAQRALSRSVFGKLIAEHGSFLSDIAKCRVELQKTRLLVLEAADQLDRLGNKRARGILAMAKVAAPNMTLQVLDLAMQVHGAAGLSSDTVLAHLWAVARTLRIADGPDEVHLGTIAKLELQRAKL